MKSIEFENRAIAFIDVLGFKFVVDAATQFSNKLKELEELIGVLESAVPSLDGIVDRSIHRDLIPKHIYISDSIILSAPLFPDKMPSYRGLSVLVMRVIQVSHILLSKGYLIRGGISVGPILHTDSNIVGPAYQEAYQIETKTLVPRVELSLDAQELWFSTEGTGNMMCLDYKGHFMVNVLHDYYIQDRSHESVERAFENYARVIQRNLKTNHPENVRYKWWWFNEYFESEMERNAFVFHN